MSKDIQEALEKCVAYAERGYRLAKAGYDELHDAVLEEEGKLQEAKYEQKQSGRIDYGDTLDAQLQELRASQALEAELRRDLQSLRERQKEFSVVVFGRTMAGKSTLMEILRHGDGASIGKGNQRTTRDVRDYRWQGMKITDVPGICAVDGRADEELAMEAAKAADLILFFVSDDAPQEEEAAKLAELRKLGKSVLGLVNVKAEINPNRRALALRVIRDRLSETENLDEICAQFREYGIKKYQQNWEGIPFVYTHLLAAFLGQKSQLNDAELYEASNFAAVEEYILEKVQRDGAFLRIKTFVDCAVNPMQTHMERLLRNSSLNAQEGMIFRRKWHELDRWWDEFFPRVKKKYSEFCVRMESEIESGIADFVEDHYEGDISAKWNYYMKENLRLEDMCSAFLGEVAHMCERKQRELLDDLRIERKFAGRIRLEQQLSMGDVSDTKTWMQVGAAGLFFVNPVAAVVASGLVALFGDSKAEKIRKQKVELRSKLTEQMAEVQEKISAQMVDKIGEIISERIEGLRDVLVSADERLLSLAHEEARAAGRMQTELRNLNMELWAEAQRYADVTKDIDLMTVARIPGIQTRLIARKELTQKDRKKMQAVLGEEVVCSSGTLAKNCKNLIGSYQDKVFEYGEDGQYYCKILANERPLKELSQDLNYRLVQQLFCSPIFNESEVWG